MRRSAVTNDATMQCVESDLFDGQTAVSETQARTTTPPDASTDIQVHVYTASHVLIVIFVDQPSTSFGGR